MRRLGSLHVIIALLSKPDNRPMKQSLLVSASQKGATQYLHVEKSFDFAAGGQIPRLDLAFETWGKLNSERSNAVLILTGLSPSAHVASNEADPTDGWWEPMIGSGRPIDTDRNFVICVNSLGSCKGSTGPASKNPENGQPYRLSFPDLLIQDIASSTLLVLESLGIEQLRAVVGPSMGGMSGLALLQMKPDVARHFLAISTAMRAEPFGISIRSLQREMVVRDPAWDDGAYTNRRWPETGMRLARKLGMISYRSPSEWNERFGRTVQDRYNQRLFGMRFNIESYLESTAKKFIRDFDPCCYLYLSRAIDLFDISGDFEDPVAAFADTRLESVMVIGVETDILWPNHQQEEVANMFLANGVDSSLEILPSIQGHDSFLVDYERFCPAVEKYFESIT
jgi:homoserine O-acetyltransferase